MDKTKLKNFTKTAVKFITNPRLLLCFGIAWIITNGWSYVCFALGTFFGIGWLTAVATTYMALLWVPFTPEKVVTVAIAVALLKLLFPNDKKTLAVLRDMRERVREKRRERAERRAAAASGTDADGSGGSSARGTGTERKKSR